jgi:hypothetical protein
MGIGIKGHADPDPTNPDRYQFQTIHKEFDTDEIDKIL